MRIRIIGAGPAGLYAAILIKRARPDVIVEVCEQNPADATFGFGVVFSDEAVAFLRKDDAETAALIEPHMRRWSDIVIAHQGQCVTIDGIGFAGIGRLELLELLRRRLEKLGVVPRYHCPIITAAQFDDADLIIGADGVNSVIRKTGGFGETVTELANRFIWYGSGRSFDALTQTFIETPYGAMTAHHYAYAQNQSTFIIEMTAPVFAKTGFAALEEPQWRRECERLFADTLQTAPLIPNKSVWRRFPKLSCKNWYCGNRVLIGDALHSAHFSIGSGTRLAMEDAIALVKALQQTGWDISAALPAFQAARQPVVEKITTASFASARWYEAFDRHMALDPWRFALSYIRRGGRLDADQLARLSPRFAAALTVRKIALDMER